MYIFFYEHLHSSARPQKGLQSIRRSLLLIHLWGASRSLKTKVTWKGPYDESTKKNIVSNKDDGMITWLNSDPKSFHVKQPRWTYSFELINIYKIFFPSAAQRSEMVYDFFSTMIIHYSKRFRLCFSHLHQLVLLRHRIKI